MTLFTGTSGWAYNEWKPAFYPPDLPRSQWLRHYCSRLAACEINATFYRIQEEATLDRWSESAPEGFLFATKAHRRITHMRSLAPDSRTRAFIERYLASVGRLGNKLGVVLLQFPPDRHRDDDALESLLDALPPDLTFAMEFRDGTWDHPQVAKRVADRGGTVCVSDEAGDVPSFLPPGPLGYVRLRAERYSPWQRDAWRTLLTKEAEGRPVFAFTKHEGIPAEDPFGGIGLACWLAENG
jgi:uncharacterized protein YecE (DUF72 family)